VSVNNNNTFPTLLETEGVGVFVGVFVMVTVGVGVSVLVGVGVGDLVTKGVPLKEVEGVLVGVTLIVLVGVLLTLAVIDGDGVGVGIGRTGGFIGLLFDTLIEIVGVTVGVGRTVEEFVTVGVKLCVGVGVFVGMMSASSITLVMFLANATLLLINELTDLQIPSYNTVGSLTSFSLSTRDKL
jgi:hypothetical protein